MKVGQYLNTQNQIVAVSLKILQDLFLDLHHLLFGCAENILYQIFQITQLKIKLTCMLGNVLQYFLNIDSLI